MRVHRPIRVCYVIDTLFRGGTELQLLSLIEGIDRAAVEPYLCLLDGADAESRDLEPGCCPVLRLGVRSLHRPSTVRGAWRFARFLRRERIDVVQVTFPDSTYFAVPVARLAGVRHIVRTRRNLGHWMRPLDRLAGRACNAMTSVTIANCEACRRAAIVQERTTPDSVVVLENGVDLEPLLAIAPPSETVRRRPRIGMVALLRPVKGPDILIRAAALLAGAHPDATFHLAGGGDRTAAGELAESCGIADRVVLRGELSDIPSFLGELDVAVLASYAEGLSNAVIEYMAAARPIVATAVGGNVEMIRDGVDGLLVPPGDPARMAEAIARLLEDGGLARRLAMAARDRAAVRYSRPAMIRRFEDFYRRLVYGAVPQEEVLAPDESAAPEDAPCCCS